MATELIQDDILRTGDEDARETGDAFLVLGGRSLRQLWTLMNTPRPVDYRGVRLVTVIFFVCYLIASFLRTRADTEYAVHAMRVAVLAYAGLGIYLGRPRTAWPTLRLYILTLAVGLPVVTGFMSAAESEPTTAMTLTALVTFGSLMFVLTPVDLLVTSGALAALFLAVIWSTANLSVPPVTATVVLIGSIGAGMGLSLVLGMYRAGMNERVRWWRASCRRERALREFAELATSQGRTVGDLLARFLENFAGEDDGARAVLVRCDKDASRITETVGFPEGEVAPHQVIDLPARVRSSVISAAEVGEPVIAATWGARDRADRAGWPNRGTHIALPISVEGDASVVVLLAKGSSGHVDGEDLHLLESVATQLGSALARADLVEQLRWALNAKSEFVNTMSHELRTPLNVIIGYAEMLRDNDIEPAFVAERIRSSGLELLQLVENTMAVAQMGTGKLGLRLETFSLKDLAAELAEHVVALPEAKRRPRVLWRVAADLPSVRLDRLKVKEVIQNLVSNGLKYSQDAVTVDLTLQDDQVRIDICDRGEGIAPDAQARIFEMFERIDRDRSIATPGVGLGLYIVKSLVDLMQGRIELSSATGVGTRFTVFLPSTLHEATEDAARPPSARAACVGNGNGEWGLNVGECGE